MSQGVPSGVDFLCDTPATVLREQMRFILCMCLGTILLHGRRMDLFPDTLRMEHLDGWINNCFICLYPLTGFIRLPLWTDVCVCVCVCMYIYIYICIHTHTYIPYICAIIALLVFNSDGLSQTLVIFRLFTRALYTNRTDLILLPRAPLWIW